MKKVYKAPLAQVVKFDKADVIATSGHEGCAYEYWVPQYVGN